MSCVNMSAPASVYFMGRLRADHGSLDSTGRHVAAVS